MKLGLVFEGGASRTIFSCGVIDALLESGIKSDYVIGTSAGISYAICYCSNQKGRNRKIIEQYMNDRRYMGKRNLFDPSNRSFYNLKFVFDTVPNELIPFDFDAFAAYEGNCIATITRIDTGETEYYELPRDDRKFFGLRATCALPLLFRPIKIGEHLYMDGGLSDSVPYQKALDDGCDKLIVVLTREKGYIKQKEKGQGGMSFYYRKYPSLVRAMEGRAERYNSDMKRLDKLQSEGKVYVIYPPSTHGIRRTENRPEILLPFHDEGYDFTMKHMDKIKEFINK